MSGFVFHPDAVGDLEDIWEHIAAHSQHSADLVVEDIFAAIRRLARFP